MSGAFIKVTRLLRHPFDGFWTASDSGRLNESSLPLQDAVVVLHRLSRSAGVQRLDHRERAGLRWTGLDGCDSIGCGRLR